MPVRGDEYVQRTKEDILAFLEAAMQEEYGEDIDLTESSVFSTFAEAISSLDAEQLEPAIEDVFDAAYLDTATGENLDKVVAILGIERRGSTSSTGTVQFSSDSRVTQSHSIPSGTAVQTDSETPIVFETTNSVELTLFDDFEGGTLSSNYDGDVGDFTVSDTDDTPQEGSFLLVGTGGTGGFIFDTSPVTHVGMSITYDQKVDSGTSASFVFGLQDSSNYYEILYNGSSDMEIRRVSGGTPTTLDTVSTPSITWEEITVEWLPDDGGTIEVSTSDDGLLLSIIGEDTFQQGGFGFKVNGSDDVYWDFVSTDFVQANAEAQESGPESNIPQNKLVVTPTTLSGVDSVTNPYSMGNPDRFLTDFDNYTPGANEETDEELRERASISEGARGDATVPAIIAALSNVDGVESVNLHENDTNTDNTGSGGLPPVSIEAVVYGNHTDQDVAEALFDVVGFSAQLYSGANGTAVSETVTASNGQDFTIEWSEPTEINIDMTLDLVVDDTYVGNDEIRDRVVAYIGGLNSDGESVLGTEPEEDVYVNQIEDAIVGPGDTGVIGVDASGTSYTPTTTTDGNGLEIIDIAADEVGTTDATDGSISINTTTV